MINLHQEPPALPSVSLPKQMEEFFSESGLLSESEKFEYRPEQQQLSSALASALGDSRPILAEAGTGVGKSLAYLIPAVIHSLEEGRKAVISTHTINLQEQLINKDIPLVKKLLRKQGIEFKALLLKGRSNYLCPNRLDKVMSHSGDLFNSNEESELARLYEWSQQTKEGSLSDLDFTPSPSVWNQVCSESHVCNQRSCAPTGRCFYQELRKQVNEADLIVVNHNLYFTLLGAQEEDLGQNPEGLLFARDFVVFDEAHTIEGVAARCLGLDLSHSHLKFQLQRLHHPRRKKGLLKACKDNKGVSLIGSLLPLIDAFFADIEEICELDDRFKREKRILQPDLVPNALSLPLHDLAEHLSNVAEGVHGETLKLELLEMAGRVRAMRNGINDFLDISQVGYVYWVEKRANSATPLSLHSAPVSIADKLRPLFFSGKRSVVLTSATLGAGNSSADSSNLNYFAGRLGAEEAEKLYIGSPFDYQKQMRLKLVQSIPDPQNKDYRQALCEWVSFFLEESRGSAFVLFTSYDLLRYVSENIENLCGKRGWNLLVQGQGKPRGQLLDEFRSEENSVLLGTDSFWQGVDVPGEKLRNVIITRLPFAVPSHPLTAAKMEEVENNGGNSFRDYSLPEAILKLRQGVGRLIRSTNDKGIVAILDNRILSKPYGKNFLRSLPECPVDIVDAA